MESMEGAWDTEARLAVEREGEGLLWMEEGVEVAAVGVWGTC